MTPLLIYVPPALPFPIQPTSTSAVVIILSSVSPSLIQKPPQRTTKPRDIRLKSSEKCQIPVSCFLIFTTQHQKMDENVKSVLHSLPQKVTKHLRTDQEMET